MLAPRPLSVPVRPLSNRLLSSTVYALALTMVSLSSFAGLVVGNGKVVTEERPGGFVTSIGSIGMDQYWVGDCNMFRFEGGAGKIAKLLISGESNLLAHLKTNIAEKKLEMSLREYIKPTQPIVVVAVATGPATISGLACMSGMTYKFGN